MFAILFTAANEFLFVWLLVLFLILRFKKIKIPSGGYQTLDRHDEAAGDIMPLSGIARAPC